jgi:hypothetical protein
MKNCELAEHLRFFAEQIAERNADLADTCRNVANIVGTVSQTPRTLLSSLRKDIDQAYGLTTTGVEIVDRLAHAIRRAS